MQTASPRRSAPHVSDRTLKRLCESCSLHGKGMATQCYETARQPMCVCCSKVCSVLENEAVVAMSRGFAVFRHVQSTDLGLIARCIKREQAQVSRHSHETRNTGPL